MKHQRYDILHIPARIAALLAVAAATALAIAASPATAPSYDSARTASVLLPERTAPMLVDSTQPLVAVDGPKPNLDYWLAVNISSGVHSFKVCGWLTDQRWSCTGWYTGYNIAPAPGIFVGRVGNHEWRRGKIEVEWNEGGRGKWDQCNTNGAYTGYLYFGQRDYVALGSGNKFVGPGNPEC